MVKCSVYIVCPSVLSYSNLKLQQTLEVKNIVKQENTTLQLTFNPRLTFTGFRTTRPWWTKCQGCTNTVILTEYTKEQYSTITRCTCKKPISPSSPSFSSSNNCLIKQKERWNQTCSSPILEAADTGGTPSQKVSNAQQNIWINLQRSSIWAWHKHYLTSRYQR